MSTNIEMLLRRFAEDLDRSAPPVTAAEAMRRVEELPSPVDGTDLVVTSLLPEIARRRRGGWAWMGAAAAVVIAVVAGVALVRAGGQPRSGAPVGHQPPASTIPVAPAVSPAGRAAMAKQFAADLASGQDQALSPYFSPGGLRTEGDLTRAWAIYVRAFGGYVSEGLPVEWPCAGRCSNPPQGGAYTLVDVPVTLQRAHVYLQLWYGPPGFVEIAFLIPPDAPASALQGQPLQPGQITNGGDPGAVANGIVADLIAGRDAAITATYDPIAAAGASPTSADLQRQWQATLGRFGPLTATGAATLNGSGIDHLSYSAEMTFARSATSLVEIDIAVDNKLRVELVQIVVLPRSSGPGAQTITTP
jgi:hypothetical protein